MKCPVVADLMSEYLDGCLDGEQCAEFEFHIGQCPKCESELRQVRDMISALRSLGGCKSPVDCWERTRERIAQPASSQFLQWLLRPVLAVPVVVSALAIALLLTWPARMQEPTAAEVVSPAEYSHYLAAHSAAQHRQALNDPEVAFAAAELERARLVSYRTEQ